MELLLDTVVFNMLANDPTPMAPLSKHTLFATHVQYDELARTPDVDRRSVLQSVFQEVISEFKPTSHSVWGESRWDQSAWGEPEIFERFLADLTNADNAAKKQNPNKLNRVRDSLIGLTAIQRRLILATEDRTLAATVQKFGGQTLQLSDI